MTAEITFAVRAMLDTVVFRRIRAAACRFAGANEGNIAILFGIAVIPIISFVGAAVDYTRANSARSSMQAALDSTALMLAKDLTEGTISTSQINEKADAYFKALYTNNEAKSVNDHRELYAELRQRVDDRGQRLRRHRNRFHAGRRLPDHGFQDQFHLGLGQRAHAGRDGARRDRIDGLGWQDAGDADGRQEPSSIS